MSWMMGKLMLASVIAAGFVNPGLAQTTIQGKVVDSSAAPVGGVDVALYVPGRPGAIQSVKTDPNSGVYKFDKASLADAFDIVYTKSMYEPVFVTRLAQDNRQDITKVIYKKGEQKPAGAVQERFATARRFGFLLSSIDDEGARQAFASRFQESVWDGLDIPIEKMTPDAPKLAVVLLQREQKDTMNLKQFVELNFLRKK